MIKFLKSDIGNPFLFLLLLFSLNIKGQSPGLNFRFLDTRNGISSDDVRSIFQDHQGFMWFGTEGGAERYDGKEFQNFLDFFIDTVDNLPQRILGIMEDHQQNMWFIMDSNGVVMLNKVTGEYVRFIHDPENPKSLSNNSVRSFLTDSEGVIWIATRGGGLNRFNKKDSTFTRFTHDSTNYNSIGSNTLACITEDKKGIIWISSPDGLLIKMDKSTGTFENIRIIDRAINIWDNIVTPALYVDDENNIWYAHTQYLFKYNPAAKKIQKMPLNFSTQHEVLFILITSIFEIEHGVFLITTYNNGYYLYNIRLNNISHFTQNTANPFGINSNRLSGIFRSNDGVVWISSYDNGINIYSKNSFRFPELINLVDNKYIANATKPTYSFLELPDSRVLMGTENNGLYIYNPADKSVVPFLSELSNYSVYDLFMDKDQIIWICTWVNGFYQYDWKKKSLSRVTRLPENSKNLLTGDFVRYLVDSKNRIWMGTMNSGLKMFDPVTGKMSSFINNIKDEHSISSNFIFKIFEDHNGRIWIGTTNGLNVYNERKRWFNRISLKIGQDTLQELLICEITEDREGIIWIGSNRGFHFFDTKTGYNKLYSRQWKGKYLTVLRIFEDDRSNLWLGTSQGICMFNRKTGEISDFGSTDGIHYISVSPNSGLKSRSGYLYFGSSRGVTVFNPSSIENDTLIPNIVITGINVNHSPYYLIKDKRSSKLPTPAYPATINLNYKQSTLTIKFAALNFNNPEANEYSYQLSGFDKVWVKAGNNNTAYYPNLPPGKYVFRVIGSNSHGYWNTIGTQISIRIKPPFWLTWWFELLAVLVFGSLIFLIYVRRIIRLKRKKMILEGIVNERTKELNGANSSLREQHEKLLQQHEEISSQNELLSQMSQEIRIQNAELEQHRSNLEKLVEERTKALEIALKKAEESDRLKSAFLANMSHEIRTPMNAIVGFANLLRDNEIEPQEKDEFIEVINSNSEVLLVLIDDILDLSLIEANQLTIRKEAVSLNEILDHLYSSFSLMNKKSNLVIRLNNELHRENLQIESDRIRIKQILTNLLNNAYKFTEKGYVELGVRRKEEQLEFYVSDSGIGISQYDIVKIFERFRKSDTNSNTIYRGTGLGLAISKALAMLLKGNLTVESTVGAGSVFSFLLPLNLVSVQPLITDPVPHTHEEGKWSDINILLVEDEQANFMYAKKILVKMDMNVYWARNGQEALNMISSGIHFNLILMDIKMPVMDGYEATKMIKTDNPSQIVIALTAYARPEDRNYFMKAGFDDYLAKPIKPNDFMGVIKRYL